jgi:sugar O-acyltransferase (sialic acid O-acetyltransferase NeuD family)
MKELVIVGASGLGKEIAWLAKRAGIPVKGFLDDNPELAHTEFYRRPVLGSIDDWSQFSDALFLIAIAAPKVREQILNRMFAVGTPDFATLIDPSAHVDLSETRVGPGSVICAGTVCTADTVIGSHCVINKLCSIGHDAWVGDFATLSPQVMLGGHSIVERGAEIGAASLVRQGLTIGKCAVVGMGAVVTKNVPPGVTVVGNPAKVLAPRKD